MMKPDEYAAARDQLVVKANELIQKDRFSLTTQQQKIVLYLISKIKPDDTDFRMLEFDILEFCRVCGVSTQSGKHYTDLKAAIKELADKSMYILLPDKTRETLIRWIEKPYFNERSGIVQIRIDEDMRPYLLQLRENFTQYELVYTLLFRSQYSLRLFELLKSKHFHTLEAYTYRVSVADLREYLVVNDPQKEDKRRTGGPEDPKYTEYRDFKRRVLSPALKEINEYGDIRVDFAEIKRGRSVCEVEFTITPKSTGERAETRKKIDLKLGDDQISIWDYLLPAGSELCQ